MSLPSRDVLLTLDKRRYSSSRKRTGIASMPNHQRKAATACSEAKRTALWNDIQKHWDHCDSTAKTLAAKHNISVIQMRRRLQRIGNYGTQQRVSGWNTYIHAKSLQINDDPCILTNNTQYNN